MWYQRMCELLEFKMPETGTTKGDISLPLYRYIEGNKINYKYGMHWTHSRKDVEDFATYDDVGYIITAKHPGYEYVMDWDDPRDRSVMEQEIGSYDYRHAVTAEVPIRPGTKLTILKIEKTEDGKIYSIPLTQNTIIA